jgi:hypothetical protein
MRIGDEREAVGKSDHLDAVPSNAAGGGSRDVRTQEKADVRVAAGLAQSPDEVRELAEPIAVGGAKDQVPQG